MQPFLDDGGSQPTPLGPDARDDESSWPVRVPVSKRGFLKVICAAVCGAGVGQVVSSAREAQATYLPGTPSDLVDTNLTIQGNLVVNQSVGVGTATPQGTLDVRGDLRGPNLVVISSDGRARQCFYAVGAEPPLLPTSATGTWGRVRTTNWNAAVNMNWAQIQTMGGNWQRLLDYSWNQLLGDVWEQVQAL